MLRVKLLPGLLLLAGVSVLGSSARAQSELVSFTYSDLNGSFDGSSLFTASDDGDSDGDVTRLVAPTGTSFFFGTTGAGGFPGAAAFNVSMTISAATASTAMGTGTIMLTDFNGDSYSGDVSGSWIQLGGSGNFIGVISNMFAIDNSSDGNFDGNSGSFPLMLPVTGPYSGNIITLAFQQWFNPGGTGLQSFSNATTLASGAIVPEPATLGLVLLGGLLAGRRFRK